jgi:hypothetical protein
LKIDTKSNTFGLHKSLIIPIAAKSILALEKYVGDITPIESTNGNAFIVNVDFLEAPNELEVWSNPRSIFLNAKKQVWVNINYKQYRKAYAKVFPEIDIKGYDIDHIFNKSFAKLFDFTFVRLLHVDSSYNRRSGAGIEKDITKFRVEDFAPVDYEIQYAEPTDMCKLLHLEIGTGVYLDVIKSFHLFYGVNKKNI